MKLQTIIMTIKSNKIVDFFLQTNFTNQTKKAYSAFSAGNQLLKRDA